MFVRKLIAILTTDFDSRIRCQHNQCNQPVYKAIHVVLDNGALKLVGSTCFKDAYPDLRNVPPPEITAAHGKNGRPLNQQEKLLLIENTARLVEQLIVEYENRIRQEQEQQAHLHNMQRQKPQEAQRAALLRREDIMRAAAAQQIKHHQEHEARVALRLAQLQGHEQKDASNTTTGQSHSGGQLHRDLINHKKSALVLVLKDGSAWVRCEDKNGRHRLFHTPMRFDWDTLISTAHAKADHSTKTYILNDVIGALNTLRSRGAVFEKVFPSFNEARAAALKLSKK